MELINNKNPFKLFNFKQIDFFIKHGLKPYGAGFDNASKSGYVLFNRDEKSELIFSAWVTLSKAHSKKNK